MAPTLITRSAADHARANNPITLSDLGDSVAYLFDRTEEFVTEDHIGLNLQTALVRM
jgi:hypothetical protein